MSFDSSRSANSNPKSKRSFNSLSSNPSSKSDSGRNSKKKKTSQKTLGMAWGANSGSSSKASFRNSPFSDFGSYMVLKNRKLHDQFDAEASSSSHSCSIYEKPIFDGVSIFVDGYTVPSSQELRGYMLKHGGRFENYFSRHRVTHIICSNLPDSKIKNLRSFSHGLPVVKPTWVLDSVAANKLLSWVPYQLEQLAGETYTQPKLLAFFAPKRIPISCDAAGCGTDDLGTEIVHSSSKDATAANENLSGKCEHLEHRKQDGVESDDLVDEKSTGAILGDLTCGNENHGVVGTAESSGIDEVDRSYIGIQPLLTICQPAASDCSYCLDNQSTKELSSSTIVGHSNHCHSTLMDPNFVENYFKNSRLHFIGTWRMRYRKRFPCFSNGFNRSSSENYSALLGKTVIIHVDMDCFFVSVVIRNHPELQDKPVAVCHSDNPRGTAEISSANYPARVHGVRSGIFVRDAKALCPHLVIFPYDFEAYEKVADAFYDILHKHCNRVQAVSCDEAFLDVTDSEMEDPQLLASMIRKEIFDTTGCTASAGIAGNMLMARLATRTAKPNGQCYIHPEKVDEYLQELPIKALPGIGHALEEKLRRRQIKTCGQLRKISKESFWKDFGTKIGEMLWNYGRGIDNRQVGVVQGSKSVGAEVNWGVRFKQLEDCQKFLMNLCKEVSLRLQGCGVQGRTFTLKIKRRRTDAEEPIKYMGCGDCENLSHSTTVPVATDDVDVLQRIATQLFGSFHIDVKDIRGMGLQVSKLESTNGAKQAHQRSSIRSWLISASASNKTRCELNSLTEERANTEIEKRSPTGHMGWLCSNSTETSIQMGAALPSLSDLDIGVIESLPNEVISEIDDMYGGKLMNLISKNKGKAIDIGYAVSMLHGNVEANSTKGCYCTNMVPLDEDSEVACGSLAGTLREVMSVSVPTNIDLMPSSLSQVDTSVLQQLPAQLRADLLEHLPAHRRPECISDPSFGPVRSNCLDSSSINHSDFHIESGDPILSNKLWFGNPPLWVHKFKVNNCWILNNFADIYSRLGSTSCFSSVLQCTLSEMQVPQDAANDMSDDAIHAICELFKQYVECKLETDIEEIYICLCFLRRLAVKSKYFLQVYNIILPHLQASVGESYGGNLHISCVSN